MRNSTLYVIPGTKFGRLASRSILGQYGTNLQNIEKWLRRLYWADTGKLFCQVDQSGAEALIVAYLCRSGNFRKLFIHGIKPHVFVALHLFRNKWKEKIQHTGLDIKADIDELCNTEIEKLKLNPFWKEVDSLIKSSDLWAARERYYYIAKQVCHSSNYGIKPLMFCLNSLEKSKGKIVLTKQDAEYFLTMYHSLFPEIREWHRRIENQVRETKMLYTLLGDPIYFSGDVEQETAVKEFYAAIPQHTVASITRQAYTKMYNFIEETKFKWDLMADTHDSYMTQSSENDTLMCAKIMKEYIELKMKSPIDGTEFQMKSECAIGRNWAPYHEKKNPEGLKEVKL